MATQTLPHVVSFPQSVSATELSQQELVNLIEARNVLSQLEAQVESMESDLKARLEAGATFQRGVHIANLKEVFRRNVAWRGISEGLADQLYGVGKGEPYCETVLQFTQPNRIVSLVVK
jgi:hypothetical protein